MIKKRFLFLLVSGLLSNLLIAQSQQFTLQGTIKDASTGEPLLGATVFVKETQQGAAANLNGYYVLELKEGDYTLLYQNIGYQDQEVSVKLSENTIRNIELRSSTEQLEEVIITGESENVNSVTIGKMNLNLSEIEKLPRLMGEADVVRSVLLLPGVSTVGEGSAGYNVRGGTVDQNLILLDNAPIYNPSHLFGFFTAFNADAVREVSLSKGGIHPEYGGRISSVLDVDVKNGSTDGWHGNIGLGFLSGFLTLEGPIGGERTSLLISGRASPSDWYLTLFENPELSNSAAFFGDNILKLTHRFTSGDIVSYTGYYSRDEFSFPGDTTYGWSTFNHSVNWYHEFANSSYLNTSLVYASYRYDVEDEVGNDAFLWDSRIENYIVKSTWTNENPANHNLKAGLDLTYYRINPGELQPRGTSDISPLDIDDEYGLETALFINDEMTLSDRLSVSAGLRFSGFLYLGPQNITLYDENLPRNEQSVVGEETYNSGEIIESYFGVEPRVSARLMLGTSTSLKAGYNRMYQYIQQISNTTAITPVDVWKLSDPYFQPQIGDQVSLGIFHNMKNNMYETSLELFYKKSQNVVDYKDGAELLLNENLEADLVSGEGRAYGVELLFRKTRGEVTGWASYTYSRSQRRIEGNFEEETINLGDYYPSNFDKPHILNLVMNYQYSELSSLAANFTYSTGRPITYPTAAYGYNGFLISSYELRNQERIPDYHRLDVSFNFGFRQKRPRNYKIGMTLSVYNIYGRKNAYSVFFRPAGFRLPQSYKLAVIGSAIPSVSVNVKF